MGAPQSAERGEVMFEFLSLGAESVDTADAVETVEELSKLNAGQITVIAAVAVGIGALCCFLYMLNKKRLSSNKRGAVPSQYRDAAQTQLALNAAVFSGLYEAIYRIGKGESRFRQGVVGDFVVRLNGINSAGDLSERLRFLDDYAKWDNETGAKKMEELTGFFLGSGIIRDSAEEITVNSETYARYDVASGERLYEGTVAFVKTPFWQIGDKILEKGIIMETNE